MQQKLHILIIIVFFSIMLNAQEDPYKAVADEMPSPVNGYEDIYKKITYPEMARQNKIEGKVYLLVYINETGGVDDVKVVKGIGAGCDEAAVDAIKKSKFNPGKHKGQPSKVKLTIPFAFKIK